MKLKITSDKNIEIDGVKKTLKKSLTRDQILREASDGILEFSDGSIFNSSSNSEISLITNQGLTYLGEKLKLKKEDKIYNILDTLNSNGFLELEDGSFFKLSSSSGGSGTTSTTSKSYKSLLKYYLTKEALLEGSELTQTKPSIPQVANNKGFLTSTSESSLLSFYQAFAYNANNYNLMIGLGDDVEVSFLCSDRRFGVAGSRRAWSPYFKISQLISQSFIDIQNNLTGTDLTAEYFIKAKINLNANGNLFITVIDGHAGVNLFGAILNIRHRVSS